MGFADTIGQDYTVLLRERLYNLPELTWLKQCRDIIKGELHRGIIMLDIGCATGYAYKSFRQFGVDYTGMDSEEAYIKIAREYYIDQPWVKFIRHDISTEPSPITAEVVICGATLEHCPSLQPAFDNVINACKHTLILRGMMGVTEDIYYHNGKHTNQYAFEDILGYLRRAGFQVSVIEDEYTGSKPYEVDGTTRRMCIVYARKS